MKLDVPVAIIKNGKRMLFQKRLKEPYKGKLGLLGGKLEKGETREDGLARELFEEGGLTIKDPLFLGCVTEILYKDEQEATVNLYVYEVQTNEEAKSNEKEGEVVWVSQDEFLLFKDEFIPTDWLIVNRVMEGNFTDFELTVFQKGNEYSVIANYE